LKQSGKHTQQKTSNGFDPAELERLSLKAIEDNNLVFINEVSYYLPCSRATFYNHGLDNLDSIKEALEKNRINTKAKMRKRWREEDAPPVLQIALYKLIGDDNESDRINSQQTKITGVDNQPIQITIVK